MLFLECPDGLDTIVKFIKNGVMPLIQFAVPIVIIILGSIDLFKAVIASKEDEIKNAQKLLIKRVIYGVAIFFVFSIVSLVFSTLAKNGDGQYSNTWIECWGTSSAPKDDTSETASKVPPKGDAHAVAK